MEKAKKETTETAPVSEPAEAAKAAKTVAAPAAPVYSKDELVAASGKVFGVSPDIVTAALRMAGIQQATVEEATKIVKEFAHKEVK